MASVSGATSSLGNTSLRGYSGLASGIDRDTMIEQMTAGTQSKITNQQKKITSLTWKQEAYRNISDKILELEDNYFSYSSASSLKNASLFAKNQITVSGDSDATKFVSATGTSSMVDYLSVLGVKQMASSTTLLSSSKGTSGIRTAITESSLTDSVYKTSKLQGTKLEFGTYSVSDEGKRFTSAGSFTFPASYTDKDADGKDIKVTLDYTADMDAVNSKTGKTYGEELAEGLNKALAQSSIKSGDDKISDVMEFKYEDGIMKLEAKDGKSTNLVIHSASSALTALGYDSTDKDGSDGVSLAELGENQKQFSENYVYNQNMVSFMAGQKLSISFGGQTKDVELVKSGESFSSLDELQQTMQTRLNAAFGTNNIKVEKNSAGELEFNLGSAASPSQTLTITSSDANVRKVLGLQNGASNKLSMASSIRENSEKLGLSADDLDELDQNGYITINGVRIEGITSDTSVNSLIEKINSNEDAGVRASYLTGSNQFVLVSTETGKGREIALEGASLKLFGAKTTDGSLVDSRFEKTADNEVVNGSVEAGRNAEILVSYGNGVKTMFESSSNTLDLDGLKVTVSGIFGDVQGSGNTWTSDTSMAVTFSAKADVDGVTEKVKKFFEDYNALVTEVNTQITTKSDSSYGPLTDEQKEEMSETSIENWEKKAKSGLLYNDSTMRSLSMDLLSVFTDMLNSGMDFEELKEMGITMSDDYKDGGTIVFDEAKFKAAMAEDSDKVGQIFTGGGSVTKGLTDILDDTLTKYATRYATDNGGSYGMLIDIAGSEKCPLSVMDNEIYRQLEEMQEALDRFKTQLQTEQDRYIQQFTTMETLISKMNTQSSYLSQLQG